MNLEGAAPVKIWDSDSKPRAAPEIWKESMVKARLWPKNLYFMGAGAFGVTLEATDVQVLEGNTTKCSF